MGFIRYFALLGALIACAVIYVTPGVQQIPKIQDVYWGPGDESVKVDESIRPFKINFSKEMIDDLRQRLRNTRKLQPALEDVGWTYGISGDYMPTVIDHWLNKYDFKKREAHLNRYPQFMINVQGLNIHYYHVKPQLPNDRRIDVVPLLLLHGWPGSVVEFQKIIPMLTRPKRQQDYVFEIIAPSLPGFGYSDSSAKAGLGSIEMAHLFKNFMLRLGFENFYVQGGDWGAVITANMATLYPQHVLGMHSNFCIVLNLKSILKGTIYSLIPSLLPEDDRQLTLPLNTLLSRALEETGYLHEQATKPDTVGVGLSDSPAGLAGYILEKFSSATRMENRIRDDGNLLEKFTMDELIDNLMMYWAPNKTTSAMRIYAETFNTHGFKYWLDNIPVTVQSACAQFPHEIYFQPPAILRDRFVNLVRVTKMPRGGHFAAYEEPELLSDDIWTAIGIMRDNQAAKQRERLERQKS